MGMHQDIQAMGLGSIMYIFFFQVNYACEFHSFYQTTNFTDIVSEQSFPPSLMFKNFHV